MLENAIHRLDRVAFRTTLILASMGVVSVAYGYELWTGGTDIWNLEAYSQVVLLVLAVPAFILVSVLLGKSKIRRSIGMARLGRLEDARLLLSKEQHFWRMVSPDSFGLVKEAKRKLDAA